MRWLITYFRPKIQSSFRTQRHHIQEHLWYYYKVPFECMSMSLVNGFFKLDMACCLTYINTLCTNFSLYADSWATCGLMFWLKIQSKLETKALCLRTCAAILWGTFETSSVSLIGRFFYLNMVYHSTCINI